MTELEFTFDEPLWAQKLRLLPSGGELSAAMLLTVMEEETEEALEEALLFLESRHIRLRVAELPRPALTGQAAVRLRMEEAWAGQGTFLEQLEENDPLRLYLQEVEQLPKPADVAALARRFASGYDSALPALTNAMLPTVIEMARDFTGRGVLLMDLIQEGSLGLWQGILAYQTGAFEPHARWWIGQYLAKAVLLQARQAGIGQKMKQAMEDYRSADQWLLTQLGRNATLEEIAAHIHVTTEEALAIRDMLSAARLMQQAAPAQPEETADAPEEQAVEDTAYFALRQRVQELLSSLDERDARILTLRFGLEGGLPLSPEEVGRKLKLTPEEVVTREGAALAKLRTEG